MLQNKIDKAFSDILRIYQNNDECMGDLLNSIKPADYDLSMEESFILYMKLAAAVDGDRFFRKETDNDFIEEFEKDDDEWFTIFHKNNFQK